jgi:membrane protein
MSLNSLAGLARELGTELMRARTFGLAAEMAFWLFLSLLPLAAVAGLVAARLALSDSGLLSPLVGSLPATSRDLVSRELASVAAWNGGKVGLLAAGVFLWLASSGIQSVFEGIEIETESAPRPWWKKRLLALASCLGLSVGLAAITLLSTGVSWLWRLAGAALPGWVTGPAADLGAELGPLAGVALGVAMVAMTYRIGLPAPTRRTMPLLPGAALAVALQLALGLGYRLYLGRAGNGGAYQAGLATIGVTMTALFLACVALLVGVEVNQMIGKRRPPAPTPPPQATPAATPTATHLSPGRKPSAAAEMRA